MAIGNPISLTDNVASKSVTIVATAGQTSFSPSGGYRINELAVYRNGVRLVDGRDFTARDGATVSLASACVVDDVVEFQIFDDFKVSGAINANDSDQTINGNLNVVGVVSATSFTGVTTGVSINAAGGALQRVVLSNTTSGVAVTMANTADLYYNNTTSTLYAPNVNVSGTMTQEDVQNIDSVGLVTGGLGLRATKGGIVVTAGVSTFTPYPAIDANEEVQVGTAIQLGKAGIVTATGLSVGTGDVSVSGGTFTIGTGVTVAAVAGVATFSAGVNFGNWLKEKVHVVNGKLSENLDINIDNGMIYHFRVAESTTCVPNITSSVGINTLMAVGEAITVSIATSSNSAAFAASMTIDHGAVTEFWNGGPPSSGNSAGRDLYTYNITKTDNGVFIVNASEVNYTSS